MNQIPLLTVTNDLIASFGPMLVLVGIVFVFVVLPLWWLKGYAVKEQKDWRIVLLVGFFFSFVIGLLLVFILPKLSDEEHARINGPSEHKSFRVTGVKIPKADLSGTSADDFIKPALIGMGVCLGGAGLMVAWLMWFA